MEWLIDNTQNKVFKKYHMALALFAAVMLAGCETAGTGVSPAAQELAAPGCRRDLLDDY